MAQWSGAPLPPPLRLDVTFLFERPKRLLTKKAPKGRVAHVVKPDLSNLIKAVEDALNGLPYHDDAQIADIVARKRYCSEGERPGIEVEIQGEIVRERIG